MENKSSSDKRSLIGISLGIVIVLVSLYFIFGAGYITTDKTTYSNGINLYAGDKRGLEVVMNCWDGSSRKTDLIFDRQKVKFIIDPKLDQGQRLVTIIPSIFNRFLGGPICFAERMIFYVPNEQTKQTIQMILDISVNF